MRNTSLLTSVTSVVLSLIPETVLTTNPLNTILREQKYLVTGAAGFIAAKVCEKILDQGDEVVGVDSLNDYYDVRLKEWRLAQLQENRNADNLKFLKLDIENQTDLFDLFGR